jgi:hypothetical protein
VHYSIVCLSRMQASLEASRSAAQHVNLLRAIVNYVDSSEDTLVADCKYVCWLLSCCMFDFSRSDRLTLFDLCAFMCCDSVKGDTVVYLFVRLVSLDVDDLTSSEVVLELLGTTDCELISSAMTLAELQATAPSLAQRVIKKLARRHCKPPLSTVTGLVSSQTTESFDISTANPAKQKLLEQQQQQQQQQQERRRQLAAQTPSRQRRRSAELAPVPVSPVLASGGLDRLRRLAASAVLFVRSPSHGGHGAEVPDVVMEGDDIDSMVDISEDAEVIAETIATGGQTRDLLCCQGGYVVNCKWCLCRHSRRIHFRLLTVSRYLSGTLDFRSVRSYIPDSVGRMQAHSPSMSTGSMAWDLYDVYHTSVSSQADATLAELASQYPNATASALTMFGISAPGVDPPSPLISSAKVLPRASSAVRFGNGRVVPLGPAVLIDR